MRGGAMISPLRLNENSTVICMPSRAASAGGGDRGGSDCTDENQKEAPKHEVLSAVVPAKAGTHNLRAEDAIGAGRFAEAGCQSPRPVVMGPRLRGDDKSFLLHVLDAGKHD